MKTFVTILFLAAVLSITHTALAADSSLELVLSDDHGVFTTASNISMEVIFRNVGETNMECLDLLTGLSVVVDGKEYQQEANALRLRSAAAAASQMKFRFPFVTQI
jgi:hypothetical protein